MEDLDYRPRAPVALEDFLDPAVRRTWIEEKGMVVLALWSQDLPATEVDVFASEPFAFEVAYARALRADLGTTTVSVASLSDLIELKRRAGRPQDLEDVRALEAIARELERGRDG